MPRPSHRDRILHAGMRRFHAAGYGATSVQQVAEAARAPKGSFYNHFPSKEALAAAALDLYFEDHGRQLALLAHNPEVPPLDRLRRYFSEVAALLEAGGFRRGCMLGNFGLETADSSETLREATAGLLDRLSGALRACLDEAAATGALPAGSDTAALADLLADSWEGAIMRMKVTRSARPLRRFMDLLLARLPELAAREH